MSDIYELPDKETITLSKPVSLGKEYCEYHEITLKEPTLDEVDKFYQERESEKSTLMGMGLLISLVSGVPRPAVRKLSYRDYKRCEVWLSRFLMWTPEEEDETNSDDSGQI
ncbi:phage tail assembly protein [Enterobacter sp. CGMCC 5087]|uniref:phage tail assembly protein n=1 Tax=Enterobacter sp. CGMCC 5087 TaxID=2183878 RepID=UPI000D677A5A|nr:phage tail assembly protein [Enterobacter sp. CGMCC 5087]PWI82144.1 phage tail assembly protein [Enterobacter sp. CGMCC 5087]